MAAKRPSITKKSPTVLVPQHQLTATQRKAIGLKGVVFKPRKRAENEALPRTFFASKIATLPVMTPARPGADAFLDIRSVGF